MKIIPLGTILLLLCFTINSSAQCRLDKSNWTLVFNEDFDSYSGSVNNLLGYFSPWRGIKESTPSLDGWGSEYYDPSQISLVPDGGGGHLLRLTATQTSAKDASGNLLPFGTYGGKTKWYKSGMLTFKDDLNGTSINGNALPFDPGPNPNPNNDRGYAYGMFEVRAKFPSGPAGVWDTWPALWLIGVFSEIDIVDETIDNTNNILMQNVLDWGSFPGYPKGTAWIKGNSTTNGDTYQGSKSYNTGDVVIFNHYYYTASTYIPNSVCGMTKAYSNTIDLTNTFNTYTAVWTPDKITFFFNGVEVNTILSSEISFTYSPLRFILSLEMHEGIAGLSTTEIKSYHMDVEYVRVYKPTGYDPITNNSASLYSLTPYKSTQEWVNIQAYEAGTGNKFDVHYNAGISKDLSNNDVVYYRDINNQIFKATKNLNGDPWTKTWISYDYGYNNVPGDEIDGYLAYNHVFDKVFYRSSSGYIRCLNHNQNGNWSQINPIPPATIPGIVNTPYSIGITTSSGDVIYHGADNKIQRLYYDNATNSWKHQTLGNYSTSSDYVRGDIQVGETYDKLFYKSVNNTLMGIWLDPSTGNRICVQIDDIVSSAYSNPDNYLSSNPGAIVWAEQAYTADRVFYIGADNKIHDFYWDNATQSWKHELIPYPYGSPLLGYANADFAKGNISWDALRQRVIYNGFDGRLQYFEKDLTGIWSHGWLNNNWNTTMYNSYNSKFNSNYIACIESNNDNIFYVDKDSYLRALNYALCEVNLDCNDGTTTQISKTTTGQQTHTYMHNRSNQYFNNPESSAGNPLYDSKNNSIDIYPNPTNGVSYLEYSPDYKRVLLFDAYYSLVGELPLVNQDNKLVIDLKKYPKGIYFLKIESSNKVSNLKLIKN